MKTKLFVMLLGILLVAGSAFAQPANAPKQHMPMRHHPTLLTKLHLTDQQKTQAEKIKFDLMKKQIDLRAQIARDGVDYKELSIAENPDENALGAKIQEIAKLKGDLHQNLLDAWFTVNKILTPEQQKIWKNVLEHPMMLARAERMQMMGGKHKCMNGGTMKGGKGMMNKKEMMMKKTGK